MQFIRILGSRLDRCEGAAIFPSNDGFFFANGTGYRDIPMELLYFLSVFLNMDDVRPNALHVRTINSQIGDDHPSLSAA